jgi:uncharacterized membrane protein
MFEIITSNIFLNKKKRKKEKFTSTQTNSTIDNNPDKIVCIEIFVLNTIMIIISIIALILFIRCQIMQNKFDKELGLKTRFNIFDFLFAIFYPVIYVFYRLFDVVHENECISDNAIQYMLSKKNNPLKPQVKKSNV